MWSQEYQNEYYQMYFDIFKKYPFICGELVWNFADFKTSKGIMLLVATIKEFLLAIVNLKILPLP